MLAVMALPTMVACGGDDDGGGVTPPTGKRLVKMTEVGEKNTYVFEYSYDSQGRVVRIDRKKNDVSDQSTTYAYTDNKIVKKTTYAAGDMRQTEYMLENGETYATVNASPYGVNFYHAIGFKDTREEYVDSGMRITPMRWDFKQ